MNRVTKRTWLVAVFLMALIGGVGLFVLEYATQASKWIDSVGLTQLYQRGGTASGTVTDRDGAVLMSIGKEKQYSEDAQTRRSMLHWLGDRQGNIRSKVLNHYGAQMAGFDLVNGVYGSQDGTGIAELTISQRVQNAALEALGDRKGTVAVYNYRTGEILCAVSAPTYDPDNVPDISGDTSGKYEGVYLNRFLQSVYIPGSIYKVVTTAAALECVPGIEDMRFTCTASYSYGTEDVTCETAHGTVDLAGALACSCNCAFAQIAEQVGRANMEKYVARYQVSQSLSFDGVTTAEGNYDISNTGGASFAWSCIGQHTDQINPARFMTFMGTIAGGGEAAMPHIVRGIEAGGEVTYQADPVSTGRIMGRDTAKTLQTYMRNNVERVYGTWNFPDMTVCGKSGTSQVGGGKTSNALFSGFVTDEKYPLAFIAVVENGGYGSAVCVPILRIVLGECKAVMDGV